MSVSTLAIIGADGPALADPRIPQIRVEDVGLLRGESVFETTRIIGGAPVDLDGHLQRLARSAAAIEVPLPDSHDFVRASWLAIRAWANPDGVLRLVATKGGDGGVPPVRFALVTSLPAGLTELRLSGISAVTLPLGIPARLRPDAPWLLGGVKATSYAVPMAGQRAAHARGADDAIWVSSEGEILEGPTSTVLAVVGNAIYTPPAMEVGTLPGLTLARVRDIAEVVEQHITVGQLAAAQEILLVSSVRGAVPLNCLDGVARPIGPFGRRLPNALEEHLRKVSAALTPPGATAVR